MSSTERYWFWRWERRLPIIIGVVAAGLSLTLAMMSWMVQSLIHDASTILFVGQAGEFGTALTSELTGPPEADQLEAFLAQNRAKGLRYIALWSPETGILASAGEPIAPVDASVVDRIRRDTPITVGDRVRVKLGPPRRPPPEEQMPGRPQPDYGLPHLGDSGAGPPPGFGEIPSGERPPPGGFGLMDRRGPPPPFGGGPPGPPQSDGMRPGLPPPPGGDRPREPPNMVLEFEPLRSNRLLSFARLNFRSGLIAVPFILGGAMLLAFLVRRQQELTERLEHGKRLAALGEMAAVIAHEIRNPLTALKGHAQLLKKSLGGDVRDEKAGRVVTEAVRLENLLSDLLEFSRSGAIDPQPIDPASLLRDSAQAVNAERIVVHGEGAPGSWTLDAPRMQQALTNILRNAVQISPDGAPVEASVFADNGHLVFEVRDHGPGLPPGEEKRIFEPFYTRKARGTGLGLALAQRIVAQHRGTISAGNGQGGGAVFRISLGR